jgi:hypothetical protein
MTDSELQEELFALRDNFLKVMAAMGQQYDMTTIVTSALCAILTVANGADNRDEALDFIQNVMNEAIAEAKVVSKGIPYMGPPGNA